MTFKSQGKIRKKLLYYYAVSSLVSGIAFVNETQIPNAMESPGITENLEDKEVVSEEK